MRELCPHLDSSELDTGAPNSRESCTLNRVNHSTTRGIASSATRPEIAIRVEHTLAVRPQDEATIKPCLVEGATCDVIHGLVEDGVSPNGVGCEGWCDVEQAIPDVGVVLGGCRHLKLPIPTRRSEQK